MNQILFYGNNLYSIVSQSIKRDFLLLGDVPQLFDNIVSHLEYCQEKKNKAWI